MKKVMKPNSLKVRTSPSPPKLQNQVILNQAQVISTDSMISRGNDPE